VKKGFGVILLSILLLSGCGGAEAEPEFDGVRVLLRYDLDIREYASADGAKEEMERWAEAYNSGPPEDRFAGTMAFYEMKETDGGYQGYLDCGDMGNFAGAGVYSAGTWNPNEPVTVTDTATGEAVTLDEECAAGLHASYEVVYGPVSSLLMGSDQIVMELNGTVRYATAGWTVDGDRATADPVILYERGDETFAIVYEPAGEAGKGKYSWVIILAVGILGAAGIAAISVYEIRGINKRMKTRGN